ncbi:cation:dicarboxylate symporter family transporter [Desulfosediminicola ganghwensis]|uniref:cation:dicarboxylate symporter family transporter n=1 Tax=Desulfosediminicola ganghwensis TaxID=2569540 RepID=UPI0010ACE6C0|nr:cation:dicarboxylase symporter family transporter [Desulfosediminicola ganghwensis]
MSNSNMPPTPPPSATLRFGLPEQVLLSVFLGIITGLFFGEQVGWLKIVGEVFIQLLQITVIPYISLALITGIGSLHYEEVKSLAIKGGSILLVIWAIAVSLVILIPIAFPSWITSSFFSTSQITEPVPFDFQRLFIPSNPFSSYAEGAVPAIVIFSILLGIALIGLSQKIKVLEPLTLIQQATMKITSIISKLSPIGVFALMADMAGTTDVADFARLQVYVVIYSAICLILALFVLPGLITVFTPFRYRRIISELRTPLITAFATGSSLIVLPQLIEQCKKIINAAELPSVSPDDADSSVEVLIPTFYTFPSVMGVLSLSFLLFGGWYIGSEVSASSYPLLFAAGVPALFAGTIKTIPFLLDLMHLPADLFQVFVSVDVITSRFGTLLSAMQYATIGLIGTMLLLRRTYFNWRQLVQVTVISILLITAILLGVRWLYSTFIVVHYTKDKALQSMQFWGTPQPFTIRYDHDGGVTETDAKPANSEQIVERGVLRVCFQPDEYPSSFFTDENRSQLVGFDIEMAHRLAKKFGLPLEFIATESEQEAAQFLNNSACDVYTRSVSVSWQKTNQFSLTSTVYVSSLGLIVRDHNRNDYLNWQEILLKKESFTVAVENNISNLSKLSMALPKATIVPIQNREEQVRMLENNLDSVDAILDLAEEGAAVTLLYPAFTLVVPKPVIREPVVYAVARDNKQLLLAINAWLLNEKSYGVVDALYNHWMLGDAMKRDKLPRWSILRDVLKW